MFGLRFSENLIVSIGEPFESASNSIKEYTEGNSKLWVEIQKYENDPLSTVKMVMKSLGPVTDYEEATFIFMDEVLSDISIFGSNMFDKLIINDEELDVNDACTLYKENYIKTTFCNKFNKEFATEDTGKICNIAIKKGCTSSCEYGDHNWRLEFDDGNIIITVFEDGDINEVVGFTEGKEPIYGEVDRKYGGIHIACYMEHTPK